MGGHRSELKSISGLTLLYAVGLVLMLHLFGFMGATALAHTSIQNTVQQHKLAPANTAVLTYHNDQLRTGQNSNETILNTSNVNSKQFGKRVSYPVDGQVYAQPLFVPNVTIDGSVHNVVYVATENDSVYAFDADQTSAVPALWHTSFINPPSVTPVPAKDVYLKYANKDISPQVGITGTPVIDPNSGTIFVVAMTKENGSYVLTLHSLDITSGQEKSGAPTAIQATSQGKGYDNKGGVITFRQDRCNQRGALLLYNGIVYVTCAAFGDTDPYHGWVLGYDATTYQQVSTQVYNDTTDGQEGGIWMSGSGPSVDSSGNMYVVTGNGDFNLNTAGGKNAGDSFVKLDTKNGLALTDYFSPFNQSCLDGRDADLGSGAPLILPDQTGTSHPHLMIGIGKEGRVYVVDRDNMGKFTNDPKLQCNTNEEKRIDIDKVVQELPPGTTGSMFGAIGYWAGDTNHSQYIYVGGFNDNLRAIPLKNGVFAAPTSKSPEKFGFSGTTPTITNNGTTPGTGIIWVNSPSSCTFPGCTPSGHGALRAYDATNLSRELYNSEQDPVRDRVDSYVKFTVPMVANGEAFVGTGTSLTIYGLLPSYNSIGVSDDANPAGGNFDYAGNSYSVQSLSKAGITAGQPFTSNGVNFTWPAGTAGSLNNYDAAGQTLAVTPVNNAKTLAFLGASVNGASSGTATITYTDGSTQTFTLGFTDWATGAASFNNKVAATLPYRNGPRGKQNLTTYLFYTDIFLQGGKTVQSVTLPSATNGMHIFAVGTKDTLPTPAIPAYNNIGTSDNGNVNAANFDVIGSSYSAQALKAAGIVPGQKVVYNNVSFTWSAPGSGSPNNYQINGQAYPIAPANNAKTLAFLGSSTNGDLSGTAIILYTDGTSQNFTLGLSDWTLGAKGTNPVAFKNGIVAKLSYRNSRVHKGQENVATYIFYTDVALQAGKTVLSVTFPVLNSQGQMHVFAIGTK